MTSLPAKEQLPAYPALHVAARDVPVPEHISPPAQAFLGVPPQAGGPAYPPLDDIPGWKVLNAQSDAYILSMIGDAASVAPVHTAEIQEGDATAYVVRPNSHTKADRRVLLEVHGGALVLGGGPVCRAWAALAAVRMGVEVWSVDYRMPPDHPYPAGLDDCLAIYRALLRTRRPEDIVIQGTSAGGNLAAALALRARDEGLSLPAAVILISPEVDLTESGDSFHTNLGVDSLLRNSLMQQNLLYAGGHNLHDPYVSPLFADFAKGFPPTFIASGTRDLFLSNAVRMHLALRRAGVDAYLHVTEAAPHGGFGGNAPEDGEISKDALDFVGKYWFRSDLSQRVSPTLAAGSR